MSRENVEVVHRLLEAANHMDVDAFVECCHPEVEWEETARFVPDAPPVYRGRRGVREWFAQAMTGLWSEWRVETADYREAREDVVLVDLGFAARALSSGIETRLRIWFAFWLADGLIIRRQSYLDESAAVEAVLEQGNSGAPTSRHSSRSTSSVPAKAFDFTPVAAGRLRAKLVERRSRVLLEPAVGRPAAAIDLDPIRLESAGGTWTVTHVQPVSGHQKRHVSVRDADDVRVATVWYAGDRQRIELEAEPLVLETPSIFPGRSKYRIEGLFVARIALHEWFKTGAVGRRPFTVEVTPALAARPDASLLVPLAAYLTWVDYGARGR
jgi:ketosteroid isomerase-like protein